MGRTGDFRFYDNCWLDIGESLQKSKKLGIFQGDLYAKLDSRRLTNEEEFMVNFHYLGQSKTSIMFHKFYLIQLNYNKRHIFRPIFTWEFI